MRYQTILYIDHPLQSNCHLIVTHPGKPTKREQEQYSVELDTSRSNEHVYRCSRPKYQSVKE